eukprot:m.178174 g.178174  ORF g.178174 m.178174 type:complete len:954 (-) comp25357_c0_seq3:66-2927(-)
MPPNNNDDWVSLAFLQTLLPGSAWGGVASALAPQLVERVRAKVDRVETRQMLFELLGESFVAKHFPSSPDTPLLLEPPFLSSTARKELHQTTRKWLLDTIKELVVNSRESLEQQTYSGFATKVFRDVVDEHLENKELEDQGAVLAAAITGVCSNFPELFSKVQARFVGKLLPPALRRTMWALKLSDADEVAKTTAILARNAKSAGAGTTSSLSSLITRVTKEKFASIPALKPQNTLVMRERCVQVLNLFHVYNDGYEPRMILLLFPILVTFFNSATDTPQAVVSHFVHFIDSCMPPRDKIFEMASRVWDTLGSVDSDLQEQILRVSKDIQSVEKCAFLYADPPYHFLPGLSLSLCLSVSFMSQDASPPRPLETVLETGASPAAPTSRGSRTSLASVESRGSRLVQSISNYRIGKTIGKGNFAKVKLARHILTNVDVAIKIIDKSNLKEAGLAKLRREVRIMKMLDHPNIVKLFEVIDTEKTLYLVMEYAAGGEVFDYLVAHGRMKEKEARAKFREILSAVQYCHQLSVIHRDLKAENLLLDADLHVKIADFGFSNNYTPGSKLDTFCGSPPYAAPELFQGRCYDGPEVDVWSLGVILYTLVSGSLPFDGTNLKELRDRVLRGKYRVPFFMSTDCEQLLKKFLVLSPSKRANLETVMNERWLNIGYDEPLKPYTATPLDIQNEERLLQMEAWGFPRDAVKNSLETGKYDHITAAYLLLMRMKKPPPIESQPRLTRPASSAALTSLPLRERRRSSTASTSSEASPQPSRRSSQPVGEETRRYQRRHSSVMGGRPRAPTDIPPPSLPEPDVRRQRTQTESDADSTAADPPAPTRGLFGSIKRKLSRKGSSDRPNTPSKDSTPKPRSLRFTFGMSNTSSKPAEDVLTEIKRVLKLNGIHFAHSDPFALSCFHGSINFEMEVCKLPRLSMNGVRHKRIGGSALGYKNICTKVLNEMNL